MSTTRTVQLWLDNEESSYREAVAIARHELERAIDTEYTISAARSAAVDATAEGLRSMLEESAPDATGMWQELIQDTINSIDFDELAEHYLDDMEIWAVFSSASEDPILFGSEEDAKAEIESHTDDSGAYDTVLEKLESLKPGEVIHIDGTEYTLAKG